MDREYVERTKYKDFLLARWQETVNGAAARDRWDVIGPLGRVVATVTDRDHAESYVDHHLPDEWPQVS